MRNAILSSAAFALLLCCASARATALGADSLVCDTSGPAMFVAGQDALAAKPAREILSWATSNLPKMHALQDDPAQDALVKSTNQQLMALVQGLVDSCVASADAVEVGVIDVSQNHVAKVYMPPARGQRAIKFVLERALAGRTSLTLTPSR